jgi:hypothetical protein
MREQRDGGIDTELQAREHIDPEILRELESETREYSTPSVP